MTDIDKLIERLRDCPLPAPHLEMTDTILNEAADAIAAQQKRIEELERPEWWFDVEEPDVGTPDLGELLESCENVVLASGAREVCRKYIAMRCIDTIDGCPENVEVVAFNTEEEAIHCWKRSLRQARKIERRNKSLNGGSDNG